MSLTENMNSPDNIETDKIMGQITKKLKLLNKKHKDKSRKLWEETMICKDFIHNIVVAFDIKELYEKYVQFERHSLVGDYEEWFKINEEVIERIKAKSLEMV